MLGCNIRTTAGLTLEIPVMFSEFLMIDEYLYELSNVLKIFLIFQEMFGEPIFLGLSWCRVSDMDTNIHPATQCMIHLIISEMEKGHLATFADEHHELVAFHIAMFIEDYENESLSFAILNLAKMLDLITTEHRQRRQDGSDSETLASIARNGLALSAIADSIRRADVVISR